MLDETPRESLGRLESVIRDVEALIYGTQGLPGRTGAALTAKVSELLRAHGIADSQAYAVRNAVADRAAVKLSATELEPVLAVLSGVPPLALRRVVLLAPDLSTVGGIQNRTRTIIQHAKGRKVEYIGLSGEDQGPMSTTNALCWRRDADAVERRIASWSPQDTVIVFPNNAIRSLPARLRTLVMRFPLVFWGSGQLSFFLQDSTAIADVPYVRSLRATRLVVLSEADRQTYRQFGIHNAVVGFNPVLIRDGYTVKPDGIEELRLGYVGRIDFRTKGTHHLIAALRLIRELRLPALRFFAPDNPKNSPDVEAFSGLVAKEGLDEYIDITYNEHRPSAMFEDIDLLLLPSPKDAFANVVLEAFSFGVPVVAMAYAPGPARVIEHGRTGFLLDAFSTDELRAVLQQCRSQGLPELQRRAHEAHRGYGMEAFFAFLEGVAVSALRDFFGWNRHQVLPELRAVAKLAEDVETEQGEKERALRRARMLASTLAEVRGSTRYQVASIFSEYPRSIRGVLRMPGALMRLAAAHFREEREARRSHDRGSKHG